MVFDVFSIDAEVNVLHPIFCPTISNIQVKDASRWAFTNMVLPSDKHIEKMAQRWQKYALFKCPSSSFEKIFTRTAAAVESTSARSC